MYRFALFMAVILDYLLKSMRIVEKYGLYGLMTGARCRHAAAGRARRVANKVANSHRDTLYRATDLVEMLKAERAQQIAA